MIFEIATGHTEVKLVIAARFLGKHLTYFKKS